MSSEKEAELLEAMKSHVAVETPEQEADDEQKPESKDEQKPQESTEDQKPVEEKKEEAKSPFQPLNNDLTPPKNEDGQEKKEEPKNDLEAFKADPDVKDIDIDKAPENYRDNLVGLRKLKDKVYHENLGLKKEIETLQAQLADRPAKEDFEKLQADAKASKERLGLFDVESTDEWKQQVSEPLATTANILISQGASYGITPEQIQALVVMDAKDQDDWIKENAPDFSSAFTAHRVVIDRAKYNAQNLKAKHPEVLAAHRQKQQESIEEQKVQAKANQAAAVDTAIQQAQTMGIAYLKTVDGDDDHNAMVEQSMKVAKGIPEMEPSKILRLAVMGAAAPQYHEMTMKLLAQVAELNAQLDKISGATPRDKGVPSGKGSAGSENEKPKGPKAWMEAEIEKQQAKNS